MPRPRRSSRLGRFSAGLSAIVVGAIAVAATAPTLTASLLALPAKPVVDIVLDGETPNAAKLTLASERLERAARILPAADPLKAAALLRLARYDADRNEPEASVRHLRAAVDYLHRGLGQAPVDGFAWTRLGLAELARTRYEPNADALAALRMSTLTTVYDPSLLLPRLALWMLFRHDLSEADSALYRRQLVLAFEQSPGRLARQAEAAGLLFATRRDLETTDVDRPTLDRYFPVLVLPGADATRGPASRR